MAEAFIGLDMLVTLSVPPGAQLQGKVSSVVAGQSLTLRDGMFKIYISLAGSMRSCSCLCS